MFIDLGYFLHYLIILTLNLVYLGVHLVDALDELSLVTFVRHLALKFLYQQF